VWLGRGGRTRKGEPLEEGKPVHGEVVRGCLGCHSGGPEGLERGRGHAFKVDLATCTSCHHAGGIVEKPDGQGRTIAMRARALAAAQGGSPHAAGAATKAAWNVLLVLEDPAAWAHNGPYARALLDEAEASGK
jgi:hypothetical protein